MQRKGYALNTGQGQDWDRQGGGKWGGLFPSTLLHVIWNFMNKNVKCNSFVLKKLNILSHVISDTFLETRKDFWPFLCRVQPAAEQEVRAQVGLSLRCAGLPPFLFFLPPSSSSLSSVPAGRASTGPGQVPDRGAQVWKATCSPWILYFQSALVGMT